MGTTVLKLRVALPEPEPGGAEPRGYNDFIFERVIHSHTGSRFRTISTFNAHPPRLQEVLLLLVPVEDGERQHAAGDVLGLLQQLL